MYASGREQPDCLLQTGRSPPAATGSNSDIACQFEFGLMHQGQSSFPQVKLRVRKCCAIYVTNSDWVRQDCAMMCRGRGWQVAASG
jgi:hypothetical protein